jgi:hypothetical protein
MLLVLWCTNWHLYFVMVFSMNGCYTLRNTSIKIGVIYRNQLITTNLNGFTKEWSMIGGGDWYLENTHLKKFFQNSKQGNQSFGFSILLSIHWNIVFVVHVFSYFLVTCAPIMVGYYEPSILSSWIKFVGLLWHPLQYQWK